MDCERIDKLLKAFLDGELAPAAAAEVERHLSECPACAALAVEARRISRAIRLGTPPLAGLSRSLDAAAILVRAREREVEDRIDIVPLLKRVAAAAAVFIIASGTFIAWSSGTAQETPPARSSLCEIALAAEGAGLLNVIDDDGWIYPALQGR